MASALELSATDLMPVRGELSEVGLHLPDNLTYDEWVVVGESLRRTSNGLMWWWGDWVHFGERCYGEKHEQAISLTGLAYNTINNLRYVSSVFSEFTRRRVNLKWAHHAEVAGFKTQAERDEWLDLAERERLTVKQLRTLIKQARIATAADEVENILSAPLGDTREVTRGEWWQLGKHRLYIGDTADKEFIERLPPAAFAFADPPYNAQAAEWDSNFKWQHDYLGDKAQIVAVTPGIVSIFDFARRTTLPYAWSLACWIDNGMTRSAVGFGNWIYTAIFAEDTIYRNSPDFFRVSIDNSETQETSHKGRKPALFLAWLLDTFTHKHDTVIDPFLGSGTTLLVAEKTGRICWGGEKHPIYAAEIIARWETQTGSKAERL